MKDNPYKRLPPLERKPDGTLCRMTPAQRKQANALIRRECCCCEDGNCIVLDDGPPEFTGGRKQKVNGKGGLLWTVRG